MSDVVLSAAVRQNLLSLQATADMLSTTQTRLATGKKVNSALDNPTNFFTAQTLDARASDLNNLLDGISNGVQVLQAANAGVTHLQQLIDSAKSIANQALQTNVGYVKSSVTTASNPGATGANLLGSGVPAQPSIYTAIPPLPAATALPAAAAATSETAPAPMMVTPGALPSLTTSLGTAPDQLDFSALAGKSVTVNGSTINFVSGSGTNDATHVYLGSSTLQDVLTTITADAGGGAANFNPTTGEITLTSPTGGPLTIADATGSPGAANTLMTALGLPASAATVNNNPATPASAQTMASTLSLGSLVAGTSMSVNGTAIDFVAGSTSNLGATPPTIGIASGSVQTDVMSAINTALGSTGAATLLGGKLVITPATTSTITITGSAPSVETALGIPTGGLTVTANPATAGASPAGNPLSVVPGAAPVAGTTLNAAPGSLDFHTLAGQSVTVAGANGTTVINFVTYPGTGATGTTNSGDGPPPSSVIVHIGAGATSTLSDVLNAIAATGATASLGSDGRITLGTTTTADLRMTGPGAPNLMAMFGFSANQAVVVHNSGVTMSTPASGGTATSAAPLGLVNGGNPTDGSNKLNGTAGNLDFHSLDGKSVTVGGVTIAFTSGATGTTDATSGTPPTGTVTIAVGSDSTSTLNDVLSAIQKGSNGGFASIGSTGKVTLTSSATSDLVLADTTAGSGAADILVSKLGLQSGTIKHTPAVGTTVVSAGTKLSGDPAGTSAVLSTAFQNGDSIIVDGKKISFSNSQSTQITTSGGIVNIATGTMQDLLDAIDKITGTYGTANASSIDAATGQISISTGTVGPLTIVSGTTNNSHAATVLDSLGLGASGAGVSQSMTPAVGSLDGRTLTIASTANGGSVTVTFGTGIGEVSTINQLNAALLPHNLQASIDTTGAITITTTNDAASSTIGDGSSVVFTGTATAPNELFNGLTISSPVADSDSQSTRANLVQQYNNIIDQIRTTAQDSSYQGINLLNGDQLKLIFNETGTSTLNITGVNLDPAGLGLGTLTAGTDLVDNDSTNKVLAALTFASDYLRSQASTLGSNLSIVQIRQDFSKNLINVLQTGSSNLTIADTNEEAANSQALSTRQQISVSALALANQSQQSVLKLLQ